MILHSQYEFPWNHNFEGLFGNKENIVQHPFFFFFFQLFSQKWDLTFRGGFRPRP